MRSQSLCTQFRFDEADPCSQTLELSRAEAPASSTIRYTQVQEDRCAARDLVTQKTTSEVPLHGMAKI